MTVSNVQVRAVDDAKLQAFLGKVIDDLGATLGSVLAYVGDKLGLYTAMREAGPLTSAQLAERTGTVERYVREWLLNQAAGGYVEYDAASGHYSLSPEQAEALTDEDSPCHIAGAFAVAKALAQAEQRISDAFRRGGGVGWDEHDADLGAGFARLFRPQYRAHLVSSWIPALSGVEEKLADGGASVADVGCGHGSATVLMAQAYPRSHFFGFDAHEPSIERARETARRAGVADRVQFEVADATSFGGERYDLVAFLDCLHEMADPVGAARRALQTLATDGSVMLVEPMAGDSVEENLNPIGRAFSGASALCCTPSSLAAGGPALGGMATEQALRDCLVRAGFRHFRRAAQTSFHRVFEARRM